MSAQLSIGVLTEAGRGHTETEQQPLDVGEPAHPPPVLCVHHSRLARVYPHTTQKVSTPARTNPASAVCIRHPLTTQKVSTPAAPMTYPRLGMSMTGVSGRDADADADAGAGAGADADLRGVGRARLAQPERSPPFHVELVVAVTVREDKAVS